MRGIRLTLAVLVGIFGASVWRIDAGAETAALDRTHAFEQAYGASFFDFDGCGDSLSGRIYRQALVDKLMHCPFTDDAKARFRNRSTMQRRKSAAMIGQMIEQTGGLPVRLQGMSRTCREQMDSPDYEAIRSRLEAYAAGTASRDDIVPLPCDASQIAP
jgi:hypothetical protein